MQHLGLFRRLHVTSEPEGRDGYLGDAGRAVPVSLGDGVDFGLVAVSVTALITAITQQQ